MSLLQGFDSILVSGYNDLTPVYRWFPKVGDGDQINASFLTFSAYPKNMTIDFDGIISGYVSGSTSDNPYQGGFYFGNLFTFKSPAAIGYFGGYSRYNTYLHLNATNGATVVYEKTGVTNPHVTMPVFEFKAIDTRMNSFQFSFSGDYTYHCVTWKNGTTPSVIWQVYSAKTSVPNVVQYSRYPEFQISFVEGGRALQYAGVDFIKQLDGSTFNDFTQKSLTTRYQQLGEKITVSYH